MANTIPPHLHEAKTEKPTTLRKVSFLLTLTLLIAYAVSTHFPDTLSHIYDFWSEVKIITLESFPD